MGFCAPYKEVKRFGWNAAVDQGIDIPQGDFQFVQYSADNVDHNIVTLDGKDTFHGMGVIFMVTPAIAHDHPVKIDHITAKAVSTRRHIPIRHHRIDNQAIADLKCE